MTATTRTDPTAAYWTEVDRVLRTDHHAKKGEATKAVAEFREHMKPAGQTILNTDPADTAKAIIGHGLIPSLPAVGAKLQLTFTLSDPKKTAAHPELAAESTVKLVAALDRLERALGGEGFTAGTPEALPGMVLLVLTPTNALGAVERLQKVATELDKASRQLAKADSELKDDIRHRKVAGERVTAAVMCQAA